MTKMARYTTNPNTADKDKAFHASGLSGLRKCHGPIPIDLAKSIQRVWGRFMHNMGSSGSVDDDLATSESIRVERRAVEVAEEMSRMTMAGVPQ